MTAPANPTDQAIARAKHRLVPVLLLMYIASFLDRANIGFAKQALQASAGISAASYAMGAGLFFITYALFEIPSNLIMQRVGARAWMCRIMVSWGIVSMATMFVSGRASYYAMRLLLGATEAGFFPGVLLYLTYWFPNRAKSKVLALFYFGAPLSLILGGPISGALLQIPTRGGIHGWQWMFLIEGLFAVVIGLIAFVSLRDSPAHVAWLTDEQKACLLKELSAEERQRPTHGIAALPAVLMQGPVLVYALIYLFIQMSVYGVVFYLPAHVSALLAKAPGLEVGMLSAIPWICALLATYCLPRVADRRGNHRLLAGIALLIAAVASTLFASSAPLVAMCALCLAASGFIAVQPLFWTLPMRYLGESVAASGLALINAAGNLGGFLAPNAKVWADVHFGSPRAGLYLLAACSASSAGMLLSSRKDTRKDNQPPRG